MVTTPLNAGVVEHELAARRMAGALETDGLTVETRGLSVDELGHGTAADPDVLEPVRLYDRGTEFTTPESFGEYQLTYRSGEIVSPRVEPAEPLALELQDFARAMLTGSTPVSHAQLGLDVVMTMEAIEMSLGRGEEPVVLGVSAQAAVA